jgi:uncharacterized RmlC-like cupin family protein
MSRHEPPPTAPAPGRGCVTVRPEHEVSTRQRLPYFVGISEATAGTQGLSMHLVVIPPGGMAAPHRHRDFETAIYVLEGASKPDTVPGSRSPSSTWPGTSSTSRPICRIRHST